MGWNIGILFIAGISHCSAVFRTEVSNRSSKPLLTLVSAPLGPFWGPSPAHPSAFGRPCNRKEMKHQDSVQAGSFVKFWPSSSRTFGAKLCYSRFAVTVRKNCRIRALFIWYQKIFPSFERSIFDSERRSVGYTDRTRFPPQAEVWYRIPLRFYKGWGMGVHFAQPRKIWKHRTSNWASAYLVRTLVGDELYESEEITFELELQMWTEAVEEQKKNSHRRHKNPDALVLQQL